MRRRSPYLFIPLFLFFTVVPTQAQSLNFGRTAVLGENEVIVGQPQNQGAPGAVHIFHRGLDGDTWSADAKLTASDGASGDEFGSSLAISRNTLLVGAPAQDSAQGAVYVFQEDNASGGWIEAARLAAGDGAKSDNFGSAVALDGDMAVIGANRHNEQTGAVYVFHRKGDGTWSEQAKLVGSDVPAGARFGSALATDGDRIFVGAPRYENNGGIVYVFRYDASAGAWTEEAQIANSDTTTFKSFGASLHIEGDYALIGSPGTPPQGPDTANLLPGAVFAFQYNAASGSWTEQARIQATDATGGNFFGYSFAVDGEQLFIGAPVTARFNGAVYTFQRGTASGSWTETAKLTVEDEGFAAFGISLVARGNMVIAGVPGSDFGEGRMAVFERDAESGEWHERASLASKAAGLETITGGQVNCTDGTAAAFDCNDVDLAAFLPVEALGGGRGVKLNDIWGWTDPQTGKEYALVGRMDGTSFVDISDPFNPVYVGDLPKTDGANGSAWRDIKVYNNHAFIVSDNAGAHGMQVFDLTQLRDVMDAPVTFEETANYDGIFSAHNIVINEDTGFAYAVGSSGGGESCGGGLHMIDIHEPTQPTFAGCFADTETGRNSTGYSHDAQCVTYDGPDTEHRGKEICFGANETALSIADVTDKDNPVKLANASYPNVGYTHQGWLTEDHRYFYTNDELDELQEKVDGTRTLVWDVEDLDDPQLVTEYFSENKASDHNLYIRGNLMYQSNYLSGLHIFDISDVANPVEVGFFDTMPFGDDSPGFGGSWSNYPFFESGAIVVTSMSEGLFILKRKEVDI